MGAALDKLSELMGDSTIATRNPMSSLSFSCLSPEVIQSQKESVDFYGRDQWKALCPLGPNGRPIRKLVHEFLDNFYHLSLLLRHRYSEKKDGHWFQGELDGNSYAGLSQVLTQHRGPLEPEQISPALASEPITADAAEEGRLRRTEFNSTTVEKFVIKGSMSKVVAPTNLPFQRLLLQGST